MTNKKQFTTVDEYIRTFPQDVQTILKKIRETIKKAAPKAHERISYGMPFYEYGGSGFKGRLIYFSLSKNDINVYIPPSLGEGHMQAWEKYRSTKSAYHIPLSKPFPFTLIAKTVQALVEKRDAEILKSKKVAVK